MIIRLQYFAKQLDIMNTTLIEGRRSLEVQYIKRLNQKFEQVEITVKNIRLNV
jgi:hypothetical protein